MAEEKKFENKVKKLLKDKGYYLIKYWGGSSFTKAGVPDLLCCIEGYFIGIEVKASHGRPSDLQIYNLRKIREAGGTGFLLFPKDWTDFKKFIIDLESGEKPQNCKYPFLTAWMKYL